MLYIDGDSTIYMLVWFIEIEDEQMILFLLKSCKNKSLEVLIRKMILGFWKTGYGFHLCSILLYTTHIEDLVGYNNHIHDWKTRDNLLILEKLKNC